MAVAVASFLAHLCHVLLGMQVRAPKELFEKLNALSKSTEQYQQMCAPRELPLVVLREV